MYCFQASAVQRQTLQLRITECFGLEETFRGHLAQCPWSEQGHLQLDQVAQSPIQPGLECFQEWGICHLRGQPVPGFHYPHCKKFLPYIQSTTTLFQFKTITPCPIATGPTKKFVPNFQHISYTSITNKFPGIVNWHWNCSLLLKKKNIRHRNTFSIATLVFH